MPDSDARSLAYYSRRAREYERIYEKPERQTDLYRVRAWLRPLLRERDLLEVACGTGYWTAWIAPVARSIVATDLSEEMIEIARLKSYPEGRVRFEIADACDLAPVAGHFDAGFAGFWWSHVPLGRQEEFLRGWHDRLGAGARAVLLDNRYAEGSSTPIARRDEGGNSYRLRRLDDGSEHEILKNFPTREEITSALTPWGAEVDVVEFDYYWGASYTVGAS